MPNQMPHTHFCLLASIHRKGKEKKQHFSISALFICCPLEEERSGAGSADVGSICNKPGEEEEEKKCDRSHAESWHRPHAHAGQKRSEGGKRLRMREGVMRNNGGASRYRSIYDVGRRSQDGGRKTGGYKKKQMGGRKSNNNNNNPWWPSEGGWQSMLLLLAKGVGLKKVYSI